VTAGVDQS